jgi:multidrug transporter EmrE-like cation transporter
MSGKLFLFLSIILGAVAQILFKIGIEKVKADGILFYFELLKNIWIYLGFLGYGISFILWMMVLKYYDVSYARPLTSLGYIVTYILAVFLLSEKFSLQRIIAIVLITAGVLLMK